MKKYLLLFVSAMLLGACSDSDSAQVTTQDSDTEENSESVETKEDTTKTAESDEAKESEVGNRSNPVPLGKSATWNVLYGDSNDEPIEGTITTTISDIVRGDEAYQQLLTDNEFNEEAPEGYEWLLFNLKLTLDDGSDDDAFNTSQISIIPIASDGSEVDQTTYATFAEGTDFGYKDIYKGGTDEGKVGLLVPVDDDTLIELTDWNSGVFFSLK